MIFWLVLFVGQLLRLPIMVYWIDLNIQATLWNI